MAAPDCHVLWRVRTANGEVLCQMLSCCSGAELQLLENDSIAVRELYPDKSDLYERARELKARYAPAPLTR